VRVVRTHNSGRTGRLNARFEAAISLVLTSSENSGGSDGSPRKHAVSH
jgi:hypothetical protein